MQMSLPILCIDRKEPHHAEPGVALGSATRMPILAATNPDFPQRSLFRRRQYPVWTMQIPCSLEQGIRPQTIEIVQLVRAELARLGSKSAKFPVFCL